ncbi:MAG: outer membrane protein assembly factor BamA [Chlorobi bacterium]|nr:outer membrane protein assembly factor BamA [Chlorobiota bacterium]
MRYSFLFLITFLLPYISVLSQTEVPKISYTGIPKKYEIADIEVTGVGSLDPKILVNLSGLRVGQVISVPGDEVTEAIKRYWKHGLFSDVKIFATKVEGRKIWLEIRLKERPRLSEINFSGLKKSEIETISDKVAMMKGSQVTPYAIDRAKKYITDYFVEKGFYNTEVTIVQRDDPNQENHVILDIEVNKKDKVKVNSLVFNGNKVLSDAKLNWAMKKTNAKGKVVNFFRTKKFVEEEFENDLQALIDKYNEYGYRDATITDYKVIRNEDNTVDIIIDIDEGEKYYFGDITWVGNSVYPSDYLSYKLMIQKGDVFNQNYLQKRLIEDEDAVSNEYMNNGYLFANITPVETGVHGDTIDIEMRVYEGQQAEINEVKIKGNTKTHEHVVRREIRTKPGQLFDKSLLIRTVRELAQLGHFDPEKINPEVLPNPEDGTVDIVYNLEEKANDQIELSGGWGAGMFVGSIGLKFSNFSIRNIFNAEAWRPLPTGDGQTLSLRAQTNGKYYQSYSISFIEPWVGGKRPNSLSVSAYYSIQTGVSSSYYNPYSYNPYGSYGSYGGYGYNYYDRDAIPDQYMKILGTSVGYGKRLNWPDDWFSVYFEASYQRYDLKDWNYFIMQNGISNNLSFKAILSRRSIDNPIYTRSGSDFSIGLEFTPPYSVFSSKPYDYWKTAPQEERYKNIEYHKWTFKGAIFKPLDNARKLVIMGKIEAGFLGYYNKYLKSPFEKFVVGGDGMSGYNTYGSQTIGVRGYENSSLTPMAFIDGRQAYDGNMYTKVTMELRYPITLQPSATVFALVFAEAGNAWSEFKDYNPFELKRSAGVGLRIFLPIFGLMGIDWGYGYDDVPFRPEAGGSQFHFIIGQSF